MSAGREARLAAMRERRGTAAFSAAGAQLVRDRRAAAEREAARRVAAAEQRIESYWHGQIMRVPLETLERHRTAFDEMLRDAAADLGCTVTDLDDGRAIELCDAYIGTLPVSKRSACVAIDLYRTEFGMTVHETLDRLSR